jgi:hypothetical protein
VRANRPIPAALLWLVALGAAAPAGATEVGPAAPVIEGVRIGTAGGHLLVEVVASDPLTYLLVDTPEPFTLTLFLSNAAFAFPPWSREFPQGPLRRVAGVVVGRADGLLARIELEFDRPVGHQIRQAGRSLFLSAGVPGPPSPVVVGTVETTESAAVPFEARTPLPPESPAPGAAPERVATAPPAAPGPQPTGPTPTAPATPAPERTGPAPTPPAAPAPERTAPAPAARAAPGPQRTAPPAPSAAPAPERTAPALGPATPPAPPSVRPGPPTASATPSARLVRIRRITPAEHAGELRVTIEADAPLEPRAFSMADPPRLVVDFAGAATDLGRVSIPTGGGLVARVRSAQFRAVPTPIVRVVLDLLRPLPYRIEPHAGGVTIRVGPAAGR